MTTIDFYTHVADRLAVAGRLVAKALAAHGSVRVLTPDAATTDALDRLLWTAPATGFLPHCRMDSPLAGETPVWIDHRLEHAGPAAVLVNHKRAPAAAPAADAKDAKPAEAPPVAFTEEELTKMSSLIKDAIGFNKDRGDSLNLVNVPFSVEPEAAAVETPIWKSPETVSIAKETGKALFLLAILGLVVMGVLRPALRQVSAAMDRNVREVESAQAALPANAPLTALPGAAPSHLAEVQRIAREDPATVANVVRSWVQK